MLAAALEAGTLPAAADSARLVAGVRAWIEDGESLEVALGLGGTRGRESARGRYRRAVRDRHLRIAHALCDGQTPWKRSVSLAAEVHIFMNKMWPRWSSLDGPPCESSQLRRALFYAMRQEGKLPETAARLHDICRPAP